MTKSQIAKKYAKVLLNTVDLSKVSSVIEEIKGFSKLIDSDRRLRLLFTSQIFSEEEKGRALNEVLLYMKVKEETRKFLNLVITQGSLHAIKEIIGSAINLYQERINKTTAEIISPVPLNEQHLNQLRSALSALTKRDVQINSRLDPSLIGGFIVKVGSTIYDSSLKGQLMLLRAELTK
jgi:ATP synthase F1 delta subunit